MTALPVSGPIASARFQYRIAVRRGHTAACDRAWKAGQCSCPGRVTLMGKATARLMDAGEDQAWKDLQEVDPNAITWRDSK